MTANKIATVLHRNTHRMAFLLIYTVLEWILIAALLLNGLFSYLVTKFASFFGLKAPCVFCSRVDHLFEPSKGQSSFEDFLCEFHAEEVSKIGFCSKHRRLYRVGDLCDDCADHWSFALPSWMKMRELGEKDRLCSYCGEVLESSFFSPYAPLKAEPRGAFECAQKSIEEVLEENDGFSVSERVELGRDFPKKGCDGKKQDGCEKLEDRKGEVLLPSSCDVVDDASEIFSSPLEKISHEERLLPLELIDFSTMMNCSRRAHDDDDRVLQRDASDDSTKLDIGELAEKQNFTVSSDDIESRHGNPTIGALEKDSRAPLTTDEPYEDASINGHCIISPQKANDVEWLKTENAKGFEEQKAAFEEDCRVNEDANCEISIGSEICDQELVIHQSMPQPEFLADQFLDSFNETIAIEPVTETRPLEQTARQVKHLSVCPVLNEAVEEGMPETPIMPNSIEGFPVLPKRFLLERRESGTESLDGSIASDIDNIEPLTVDRLKAALKAERKALSALYSELEEERSASAIATNQTMAMITRLQEEKAAMQMEALQYHRMMEEQSEYDQEALQLLNELMMKREREKQDLEKEVEMYHEQVLMYEARGRSRKMGSKEKVSRRCSSSVSTSAEDTDDLSFDSHEVVERKCIPCESNLNTPIANAFSYLHDKDTLYGCLADFEESRIFILEQLKELEERLFKIDDERMASNNELTENYLAGNGHRVNGDCELFGDDTNGGYANGSSHDLHTNGMLLCELSLGVRGKMLLPVFDAISLENDDKLSTKHGSVDDSSPDPGANIAANHKKLAITEEVDQLYRRVQALEMDSNFLNHCISLLKKGDQGLNLLQEILQRLHVLRCNASCYWRCQE